MKSMVAFLWAVVGTALVAGCGSPDPSAFTCSNSAECPTGYFCSVAAARCAKGADTTAPTLLAASWDKTSVQPGGAATLTFTSSKPVAQATVAPDTAIHDFTVGAIAAVSSGAPNTYRMAFTAPAACDGVGTHPGDAQLLSIGISFRDSAGNSGTGPVGQLSCDVPKTLAVNATKIFLIKQPFADGTVRTTLRAAPGAAISSPSFAGVTLTAMSGTNVLGSAAFSGDGSAQQFELPGAPTQVSVSVRDRTGVAVPVTGYSERVVLSFTGKDMPGTQNTIAAYDTATVSDSQYAPATWIASGPGPDGGPAIEIGASSVLDGGVVSPATYSGLAALDGINIQTSSPSAPDRDGGTPLGWEQLVNGTTSLQSAFAPSPRSGMTVASSPLNIAGKYYQIIAYGGLDGTNAPSDPVPTAFAFDLYYGNGWAPLPQPPLTNTGVSPFPSNNFYPGGILPTAVVTRAQAAIGQGGQTYSCPTPPCTNETDTLVVAGGVKSDGSFTDRVYAFGDKVTTSNGNRFSGWWDKTAEYPAAVTGAHLAYPNAGMAYANSNSLCVPSGNNQLCGRAMVMTGGRAVTSSLTAAQYDAYGCQFLVMDSYTGPVYQMASCIDPNWATGAAAGAIGMRQAPALSSTDWSPSTFYLFGGNRIQAPIPANNGLQNDLWVGTITVKCSGNEALPCSLAGSTAVQQVAWTQFAVAASPKPSPRSGASIALVDYQRITLVGGTDATGPRSDVWDLDLLQLPTPTWRLVTMDAAPALGPAPRTGATMLSGYFLNGRGAFIFNGATASGLNNEVWAIAKEAPGRLLVKAPTGISNPAAMANASLSIRLFGGNIPVQISGWDGSTWRSLGVNNGGDLIFAVSNAAPYIQPDGNLYLLLTARSRLTPGSIPASYYTISLDAVDVELNFQ